VNTIVSFRTLSEQAEERALIDSGATENFIDQDTWARMGIGKRATVTPLTVYNVDGSENKAGKITHYCWLRIIFNGKNHLQKFYIASLGKDNIILGYPFLYLFNPTIDLASDDGARESKAREDQHGEWCTTKHTREEMEKGKRRKTLSH
jgi:hypothetical protein